MGFHQLVTSYGLRRGDRKIWLVPGALFAVVGAYAVGVSSRDSADFSPLVDGFLGLPVVWLPAAVGWWMVIRMKRPRMDILLSAGALSCHAAGSTYYALQSAAGEDIPLLSLADVCHIGFYVLMLAALAVIVRNRLRDMTWPVVLDSTVGTLGAAAVLTVVLEPVLNAALDGPGFLATAVDVAYPFLDFLLVATVIGIAVTARPGLAGGWRLLVLGLIIYAGVDIAYALLEVNEAYIIGTPLDVVWGVGTALVGSWIVFQGRAERSEGGFGVTVPAQAVPALATIAGLGVLVLASQQPVVVVAVVLASLTLAMAALPLVFRQRIRLSDANRQARTDELTGLPNRRALYTDLPSRLGADARQPSVVLLLDLDKFKEINDGLGHDAGDRLLMQVAERLSGQLRATDLLARMGGDEFVVHVVNCGPTDAQAVALRIRAALAEPYDLGGVTVHVNASIGISCYPQQGRDLSLLLRKADLAMYCAKSMHSGHALYTDSAIDGVPRQFHTVQALNDALLHDQLVLHFQPKIDLASGDIRGVEALVRWEHPTLGLLQPDTFLKRFDETGLMPALTGVVLGQALDQAAVWAARELPLSVAVNFPASSVMDSGLPAQIAAMTAARGLPASALVLEITEDVLVADRNRAHTILAALREMGVRIAVDDFGKGYSSLSYLRELPVDELKLDKSFILTMMDDARATALVVSTIDLAHSLGLEMTAEGVEDAEAFCALRDYGCDVAQGYFMSKPVPAAELDTWLSRRSPLSLPDDFVVPGPRSRQDGARSET